LTNIRIVPIVPDVPDVTIKTNETNRSNRGRRRTPGVVTWVRLPEAVHGRLKTRADRVGRPMAELIRVAVEISLRRPLGVRRRKAS
jgi:hypothetical protein